MKNPNWKNLDNFELYENMPLDVFYQIVIDSGLDDCCDIKAISTYVSQAESILEVGAGCGRILDYLISSGYAGKLVAIERISKFCDLLEDKFSNRVEIINADILDFTTDKKFDLILFMWTGICEFSKSEQIFVLNKLLSILSYNGRLIIDLMPISSKTINAVEYDQHNRTIQTIFGNDHGYFPSDEEITSYASVNGVKIVEKIEYETKIKKIRNIYVFG
jgi:phospholipid N-methyltransferase